MKVLLISANTEKINMSVDDLKLEDKIEKKGGKKNEGGCI
jgi:hypothetical protein